ncbi:MAG: hypothetical protein ACYCT0_12075 [Sulfobacillus sp.]
MPKIFRFHSLAVARAFGVGWERALRQTWIQDRRPERVLRLHTRTQVWGLSVVGGYGDPLGRMAPFSVIPQARGHWWGEALLGFTL